MFGRVLFWGLAFMLVFGLRSSQAQGLGAALGESYVPARHESRLGPAPGSGANPLGGNPGAGEAILERGMGGPGPRFIPEPFPQTVPTISPEGVPAAGLAGASISTPARLPSSPLSPNGSLAIPPGVEDIGPPDGLTLDQAIERLIRSNLDLYSKSFELPQADADLLTAGLRANPVLYTDVQNVPYGSFSTKRPGGQTQYDINVSYPLDLTHKRRARTLVAFRAKRVLECSSRTPSVLQLTISTPSSSMSWLLGRRFARPGRASRIWRRSQPPIVSLADALANATSKTCVLRYSEKRRKSLWPKPRSNSEPTGGPWVLS